MIVWVEVSSNMSGNGIMKFPWPAGPPHALSLSLSLFCYMKVKRNQRTTNEVNGRTTNEPTNQRTNEMFDV